MSDIKWIKITTNIFDDEKIRLIETLPDHDTILVIWLKLLSLAGKCNDCGLIYLNKDIPYTDEMLSTILRRPVNTVRLALQEFQNLKMIEIYNDFIAIINWEKHQNIEKLDLIKEQSRISSQKYREKQKKRIEKDVTSRDVTVIESDATDKNRIDKNREEKNIDDKSSFNDIKDIFIKKSKQIIGEEYYHDGKQAKAIKSLENRYRQDKNKFISLIDKFIKIRENDKFFFNLPIDPHTFNTHYNKIISFKLSQDIKKNPTVEELYG